ncbi:MAG: HD domain-containing phosphohydrolase [Burkholderiales bacterium]
MAEFRALKFRFHTLSASIVMMLMLLLTALFLHAVVSRFNAMAENNAQERFQLLARSGAEGLINLIDTTGRSVKALAAARRSRFVQSGQMNENEMVLPFLSALQTEDQLYGVHFALENDDFLQIIGVRDDPATIKLLSAPAGTYFALRRIQKVGSGQRETAWEYWSAERQVLGTRKEATDFLPTKRPWYEDAMKRSALAITAPYLFASTGKLGVTVSHPLRDGAGVVAADINLSALQVFLSTISLTPEAAIVVLDSGNRVMASYSRSPMHQAMAGIAPLTAISATENPYLKVFDEWRAAEKGATARVVDVKGERFVYAQHVFSSVPGHEIRIGAFAPMREFSGPIVAMRNTMVFGAGLFILVLTPFVFIGARRIGATLSRLSDDAEHIRQFDFSGNVRDVKSMVYEVDTLAHAQTLMKDTVQSRTRALTLAEEKLANLVRTGILLSREQDRQKLLRHILFGGKDLLHCDAATMYLKTESGAIKFAFRTMQGELPSFEIPLQDAATGQPNDQYVSVFAANHNQSVSIDDVYQETRFDLSGTRAFADESGYRTVSMLTVPMSPREGEVTGVLQFMNALDAETGKIVPFAPGLVRFVEALAAQAAVALENQNLLEAQRALMDSMIKLLAGAIDAKSPYTGGHCERVPELAIMLADEATKVTEGPLAAFRFASDVERREFRIGAWLHDCGKVTTPEYVVDKATKLETIYNRMHEIRTRFEVLLRDAEIDCLKAQRDGGDTAEAAHRFDARRQELTDDFVFLAECNVGGEFMAPDRVERLKKMAAQPWMRHFDDRIGLSNEELVRYRREPAPALPVVETLLADKPHHIVPRGEDKALDPKYGFKVKVPEHLFNFGEVYNLSVGRGTLTEEERFKINEHIIQTIVMLDQMPFPKELQRVPEYAGTHHETLNGTGYPRKLDHNDLSVPARIMAIADIFEALTASDRPYKSPKTLSDSIKILSFFKKDKHIDPDLFDLFLRSGVYQRYAERYLKPEQIDHVDIEKYLS